MPKRIQLSRAKGWRKPEGAVVVARPTRWGNPFPISKLITREESVAMFRSLVTEENDLWLDKAVSLKLLGATAMEDYKWPYPIDEIATLAGHDLACWCPPDQSCHADVLLELANFGNRPTDKEN